MVLWFGYRATLKARRRLQRSGGRRAGLTGVRAAARRTPILLRSSCTSSDSTEGRNSFTKALGCSHSSFLFYSKQEGLGLGHSVPRGSPEVRGPMFRSTQTPPPPASSQQAPKSQTTVHRGPACCSRLPLHTCREDSVVSVLAKKEPGG